MFELDNIRSSAEVKELFLALNKAQKAIHHASKDSTNPHFRSKYASLESALDACKPAFNDNGIAVIQIPGGVGKTIWVDTILAHTSGQFLSGRLALSATQDTPQAAGSAITYARRYSILGFAGIGSEDDDANEASKDNKEEKTKPPTAAPLQRDQQTNRVSPPPGSSETKVGQKGYVSQAQVKWFYANFHNLNLNKEKLRSEVKERFGVNTEEDLNWKQYKEYREELTARMKPEYPPMGDEPGYDPSTDIPF